MNNNRVYVITTSIQGRSKTQIWESSKPLALGHPFQWILERSDKGVRLRKIGGEHSQIEKSGVHEIPNGKLNGEAELEVPSFSSQVQSPFKIRIKPVLKSAPAFALNTGGETLRIYRCAGHWVMNSETFSGSSYTATVAKEKIFSLKKVGSGYALHSNVENLHLVSSNDSRALRSGESIELSMDVIQKTALTFVPAGSITPTSWRFGLSNAPEFVDRASFAAKNAQAAEEARQFKKSLTYTGAGLAIFAILAFLWPKPKPSEELVPQQFTQIVMAKPQKASAAASSDAGTPSVAKDAPKKVQEAAVVQAFRAKALNNAVQGLLKGGMTKLLAQSDFVSGNAKSMEARNILNSKSNALRATAPSAALGDHNVQVASLGGDAKGENGKAVGYGKGDRASVQGQGKGFVPFVSADANGSVVDEGLTKDEVGEVIHKHLSEVRYCYESAMVRTPDVEGKLITAFVIGANGVVKSAEAKSSTLPDPRLDDCIIRRLMTWAFPKPRGGVVVAVSYPFIFKTLGR